MNDILKDITTEGAYELVAAIVLSALKDWRTQCRKIRKGLDVPPYTIKRLRQFFYGGWCEDLCGKAIQERIIKQIEAEYAKAKEGAENERKGISE
jgi:hypothetical protein